MFYKLTEDGLVKVKRISNGIDHHIAGFIRNIEAIDIKGNRLMVPFYAVDGRGMFVCHHECFDVGLDLK